VTIKIILDTEVSKLLTHYYWC